MHFIGKKLGATKYTSAGGEGGGLSNTKTRGLAPSPTGRHNMNRFFLWAIYYIDVHYTYTSWTPSTKMGVRGLRYSKTIKVNLLSKEHKACITSY